MRKNSLMFVLIIIAVIGGVCYVLYAQGKSIEKILDIVQKDVSKDDSLKNAEDKENEESNLDD